MVEQIPLMQQIFMYPNMKIFRSLGSLTLAHCNMAYCSMQEDARIRDEHPKTSQKSHLGSRSNLDTNGIC